MAGAHVQGQAHGASTAPAPAPAATPAATVLRPDPGLRRGVWEAPPWAFYVGAAVVVVAAAIYAARRLGLLRLRRRE